LRSQQGKQMRHEFSEVLNDLIDYFLVGDIQLL